MDAFNECVEEQEDGAAEHLQRHLETVESGSSPAESDLQISESWL